MMEKRFGLWQKIATAQTAWTLEIIARLELTAALNPDANFRFARAALVRQGEVTAAGTAELNELTAHTDLAYWHICKVHGAPLGSDHPLYNLDVDMRGVNHHITIAEAGLVLIDVVFLGPAGRAAELIAADPRLHAAASSRVLCCNGDDAWGQAMAATLARADAMLAAAAIEEVLNGKR